MPSRFGVYQLTVNRRRLSVRNWHRSVDDLRKVLTQSGRVTCNIRSFHHVEAGKGRENFCATEAIVGVDSSDDLKGKDSQMVFNDLKAVMGHRHDPCLYYTQLSVKHFIDTGESLLWWKFTVRGKADLASSARSKS